MVEGNTLPLGAEALKAAVPCWQWRYRIRKKPLAGPWRGHRHSGKKMRVMNTKLFLILLQWALWCTRHARGRLEHRIGHGWDQTLSRQLDQLVTIESLLTDSFVDERAA